MFAASDLIAIGAYQPGTDALTDATIGYGVGNWLLVNGKRIAYGARALTTGAVASRRARGERRGKHRVHGGGAVGAVGATTVVGRATVGAADHLPATRAAAVYGSPLSALVIPTATFWIASAIAR